MRIVIYGLNYTPELTGIGKYTGEMVQWLADHGHECRVITAPPYYPAWKVGEGYSSWFYSTENRGKVTIFRCPLYVPQKPKTLTRILHYISFAISSSLQLFRQIRWSPDLVICIAPSFFCAPQTMLFSKISGAKSWLHFQDFEICAMFGSGMFGFGKSISLLAHKIQAFITRRFNSVSTISHTMCSRARTNNVNKKPIVYFPNWVDTDFISPKADRRKYRSLWKISEDNFVVLYSGNLGKKQGLELIVDVAKELKHEKQVKFVIVEGLHRELEFVMDADLFMRMLLANCKYKHIGRYVGGFRKHELAKTVYNLQKCKEEHLYAAKKYWPTGLAELKNKKSTRMLYLLLQVFNGNISMKYETFKYRGKAWKTVQQNKRK